MKRIYISIAAIIVLAALAAQLSGCSSGGDVSATLAPDATMTPSPTPVATPSPTPMPTVAIDDYRYATITNGSMQISFQYPAHWINDPGKLSIRFVEPVSEGQVPSTLSVTSKKLDKEPTQKEVESQLTSFLEIMRDEYPQFVLGESKSDVKIMDGTGIRQKYLAVLDSGESVTGYVLLTYAAATKRLYLFHFCAPTVDYDSLAVVIDIVRNSMEIAQ